MWVNRATELNCLNVRNVFSTVDHEQQQKNITGLCRWWQWWAGRWNETGRMRQVTFWVQLQDVWNLSSFKVLFYSILFFYFVPICSSTSSEPQCVTALCWFPLLKHCFPTTCFVYMVIYWLEDWFEHLSSVHNTFRIQLSPVHLTGLRGGGECQEKKREGIQHIQIYGCWYSYIELSSSLNLNCCLCLGDIAHTH